MIEKNLGLTLSDLEVSILFSNFVSAYFYKTKEIQYKYVKSAARTFTDQLSEGHFSDEADKQIYIETLVQDYLEMTV